MSLHLELAHELRRRHLHALLASWMWGRRLADDELADEVRASLAALRGLRELLGIDSIADAPTLVLVSGFTAAPHGRSS